MASKTSKTYTYHNYFLACGTWSYIDPYQNDTTLVRHRRQSHSSIWRQNAIVVTGGNDGLDRSDMFNISIPISDPSTQSRVNCKGKITLF